MTDIIVRPVVLDDLPKIVKLEEEAWTRHSTPILTIEELEAWFAPQSPYFLVAEKEGVVSGYYYGIQVDFAVEEVDAFVAPPSDGGAVYMRHRHTPRGRSVYGISVASTVPGSGEALNARVHELLHEMDIEYFVGFTRLLFLGRYLESLRKRKGDVLPYEEEGIALWYAHESARMLGMRVWNECTPQPDYALPLLRRPDPVMAFHAKNVRVGLLRILKNYMEDPASKNYGAFIASRKPHQ